MTSRDPRAYLEDILTAAKLARQYVGSLQFQQFADNVEKQDAVIHRLEIIGEAAGRVGPETTAALPGVPWSRMKGMRNIIAHQYWGIDLKTVWAVVHEELPLVIGAIEAYSHDR